MLGSGSSAVVSPFCIWKTVDVVAADPFCAPPTLRRTVPNGMVVSSDSRRVSDFARLALPDGDFAGGGCPLAGVSDAMVPYCAHYQKSALSIQIISTVREES